ncbi:MAG: vitamin K epoxide reductase family protein [Candidatus Nanopelagicales bacterium]
MATRAQGTTATDPAPEAPRGRHTAALLALLASGLLGLVASLVLAVDAVALAEDPLADLSCNISSTISCATVGVSWQASLLGFPNAFLGLMGEPVVITIAVAALAGVRFPRWFMLAAQAGITVGLGFAVWLFVQSYFVIGAICPWCTALYVTSVAAFAAITRITILDGLYGPAIRTRCERPLRLGVDVAGAVIVLAIVAAMVVYKYL